jgi:hypothetical protein
VVEPQPVVVVVVVVVVGNAELRTFAVGGKTD